MNEFDWLAFEERKIAVNCPTEEEAIDFCNQSHMHKIDWRDGTSFERKNACE